MGTIRVYGDSNSSMWGTNPGPGQPWPTRFGTRLVGEAACPARVVNRAIGGQQMHLCRAKTSPHPAIESYAVTDLIAAERAQQLPGLVMLCAGTNDLDVSVTPDAELEDLLASYETLDETIRSRWGVPLLVISVLPMRVGGMLSQAVWEQREPRRQRVNTRLRTLFGPTGRFFDADTVIGEGMTGGVQTWSPYVYDALHLNWMGHVRLADALPLTAITALEEG
ncbi:SGNH/GDSL hydrolase family protein [Cellulomonas endometrii]|uniref:SGNH/GDSL hydrolase family protein n=1 Tax=Cellulomonas endometrii TaxID=3036301 RepID=UPI0024AD8DB7|nr:SGNH/GDSL hydrolase family protein [Cellulomonas endometrii]